MTTFFTSTRCLLLFLLASLYTQFASLASATILSLCQHGTWRDTPQPMDIPRMARTSHAEPQEKWLSSACRIESSPFSCHFANSSLGQRAEHRRWFPHTHAQKERCAAVDKREMLRMLTRRRLVFFGDSVVHQIFQHVVCALDMQSNDNDNGNNSSKSYFFDTMRPVYENAQNKRASTCPFGDEHCNLLGGYASSARLNASLEIQLYEIHGNIRAFLFQVRALAAQDILVFNFGLHHNDEEKYRRFLLAVRDGLDGIARDRASRNASLPTLFFLETTPQHFASANGYYDGDPSERVPCQHSLQSYQHKNHTDTSEVNSISKARDWRNDIAKQVFSRLDNNNNNNGNNTAAAVSSATVRVIPIARVLSSQGETHIGDLWHSWGRQGASAQRYYDCTHFCAFSGVFDYILLALYNALLSLHLPMVSFNAYIQSEKLRKSRSFDALVKGRGQTVYGMRESRKHALSFEEFVGLGLDFADVGKVNDWFTLDRVQPDNV